MDGKVGQEVVIHGRAGHLGHGRRKVLDPSIFLKLNFLENIRGFFVDYNFGQFLIATLLICQMTDELGRITDDFFVKRVGGKVTNSTKLNISFMYSWSIFTGQPIKN